MSQQVHVPVDSASTSTQTPSLSNDQISQLQLYSACDISDALLKLQGPGGGGFIADLIAYHHQEQDAKNPIVTIAPVFTVLFALKDQIDSDATTLPTRNIPPHTHWVDLSQAGSFVVLKQPPGQSVAVCGGIMALRMKMRRVKGIIVAGRVRDVQELKSTGLPILAHGTSTTSSSSTNTPWAIQVPIEINGVVINPGDIAFHDPLNGVVIIPRDKVDRVLELLPDITAADARVKQDVLGGMSVYEAFELHRGK